MPAKQARSARVERMTNPEQAIIRVLEHVSAHGIRPSHVFEDWIACTLATLEHLPAHAASVRATGKLAVDTPETQALWARVRRRYEHVRNFDVFSYFGQALGILLETPALGYRDTVGSIFMQWGNPNPRNGQFFTPMEVAMMMAQMTIPDGEAEVHRRLLAALRDDPLGEAMLMAGMLLDGAAAEQWFWERVLPQALRTYTPITVCDPCCGSGVMLLAGSSRFPRWSIEAGLVQFSGQDIDHLCVQMAKINIRLYGLNGTFAIAVRALHGIEDATYQLPPARLDVGVTPMEAAA